MRAALDGTDGQDLLDSRVEARVGNDEGTGTKPWTGHRGAALSDSFQGRDSPLRAQLLNILADAAMCSASITHPRYPPSTSRNCPVYPSPLNRAAPSPALSVQALPSVVTFSSGKVMRYSPAITWFGKPLKSVPC